MHDEVIALLDGASECLELTISRLNDVNVPARYRLFLPRNQRDFKEALLPFSIILERGRVPVSFNEEYRKARDDFEGLWHDLINAITPNLTQLATPLLDEARIAIDEAILRFDSILDEKAKLGRPQLNRLYKALTDISEFWSRSITTSGHPELTPAQVQRFTLTLPDGTSGVLNEYARTHVIDLDHPEHNFASGHIRLKKVDTTFIIPLTAIEPWYVIFALLTGTPVDDQGSVLIPKRDGKPVLDCFKRRDKKTNGVNAFRRYVVNVSSANSPGGRTGRKTSNLFRIDPVNGPELNEETSLRRKGVLVRQRPHSLPHIT